MKDIRNWRPEVIYDDILRRDPNKKRIYVIFGRTGPTGKTWLCTKLREEGYTAVEISETLSLGRIIYDYPDDDNHYVVDDMLDQTVIVLNQILPAYRRN